MKLNPTLNKAIIGKPFAWLLLFVFQIFLFFILQSGLYENAAIKIIFPIFFLCLSVWIIDEKRKRMSSFSSQEQAQSLPALLNHRITVDLFCIVLFLFSFITLIFIPYLSATLALIESLLLYNVAFPYLLQGEKLYLFYKRPSSLWLFRSLFLGLFFLFHIFLYLRPEKLSTVPFAVLNSDRIFMLILISGTFFAYRRQEDLWVLSDDSKHELTYYKQKCGFSLVLIFFSLALFVSITYFNGQQISPVFAVAEGLFLAGFVFWFLSTRRPV